MHRTTRLVLAAAAVGLAACAESPTSSDTSTPADLQPSFSQEFATPGTHVHVMPPRGKSLDGFARGGKPGGGGGGGKSPNTGIYYHGGPIVYTPKVAAIYWSTSTIFANGPTPGTSGAGSGDASLVGYFMRNLGGSDYWQVNTTYTDGGSGKVGGSLAYSGYWATGSNPPASPSDGAIQSLVATALSSGKLAFDDATVYAVFTGPGVNLGGGFGSQYCAYHGHFSWNGHDVKYAAMPYNADYPSGCSAGQSPNGDFPADAEVNTLAHEIEEFATDPSLNAWFDRRGYENADKCAWKFGSTYPGATGDAANIRVGTRDFLVQQNWINAGSGGCVLSLI